MRTNRDPEDLETGEFHQRSESALVLRRAGLQYDRIGAGNKFSVTKTRISGAEPERARSHHRGRRFSTLWVSNVIVRYLAQKGEHDRL
jgi:hypothetical protein